MLPAASVSGLYFSHPQAKYFNVGRIGRDQVESYAQRKGCRIEEVERWLAPNLAVRSRHRRHRNGVKADWRAPWLSLASAVSNPQASFEVQFGV